jgi:hypothetical protein
MYYVRLEPAARHKREGAHKTKAPWGVPAADAHFHDIGLHPHDPSLHHTLMVPGYAAADLVADGARLIGIFEIRDGQYVPAAISTVEAIDVAAELERAPDHEIRRYLTHHDAHPAHEHRSHVRQHDIVEDATGRPAKGPVRLVSNPVHPAPDELRRRALAIHHAKRTR